MALATAEVHVSHAQKMAINERFLEAHGRIRERSLKAGIAHTQVTRAGKIKIAKKNGLFAFA